MSVQPSTIREIELSPQRKCSVLQHQNSRLAERSVLPENALPSIPESSSAWLRLLLL